MSDSGTVAKASVSKMFGAPGTVRSPLAGKDMKKENISIKTTTTNPFGAPTNTPENSFGASLNSPNSSSNTPINAIINPFGPSISTDKAWLSLEPIVSSAMNNATSVSSTRSVPSTPSISRELGDSRTVIMPASSNLFGSSTAGFSFGSPSPTVATSSTAQISGQASVNGKSTFKTAPKSKIVSIFQQLTLLLAPHKAQSDIIHAPSPKRAKTVHSIAAQLPANEFTKKLDLFRGPEVHVTAGISLAVKSYRLPKALLLAASPFFETAIEVETIGSLSQEILRMDCSSVVFDLVVQYLYTGTFVCPSFLKKWEPQQLVSHHEPPSMFALFCIILVVGKNGPRTFKQDIRFKEDSTFG